MEKEFENEFGKVFGKVTYLKDLRTIVIEWHGYTTKYQLETVMSWVDGHMLATPIDTIINDCTHIISVWGDSIDWFTHVWLKKMRHTGLNNFLHIAKPGSFGEKIGKDLLLNLDDKMLFYTFRNRSNAIDWIRSNR
jgi:hypothetical protein